MRGGSGTIQRIAIRERRRELGLVGSPVVPHDEARRFVNRMLA